MALYKFTYLLTYLPNRAKLKHTNLFYGCLHGKLFRTPRSTLVQMKMGMMEFMADMALEREILMVSGYWSSVMQWNWLLQTLVSRHRRTNWPPMYLLVQWVQSITCCCCFRRWLQLKVDFDSTPVQPIRLPFDCRNEVKSTSFDRTLIQPHNYNNARFIICSKFDIALYYCK